MLSCMLSTYLAAIIAILTSSHFKKRSVSEHPRGVIFYCFHGNLYCYHGNSKILLPWGVQLHRVFYNAVIIIIYEWWPTLHGHTLLP